MLYLSSPRTSPMMPRSPIAASKLGAVLNHASQMTVATIPVVNELVLLLVYAAPPETCFRTPLRFQHDQNHTRWV